MIRVYEINDVREGLFEELEALMPQLSATAQASRRQWERMISAPLCHLFVAEVEGRTAGMLTLALYDTLAGRRGWIEDVVVDQNLRGKGVGKALLQHALQHARNESLKSLSLTSAAHRTAARSLYRKMGFEEVDTTLFRLKTE